jgi:hypothetical protein
MKGEEEEGKRRRRRRRGRELKAGVKRSSMASFSRLGL